MQDKLCYNPCMKIRVIAAVLACKFCRTMIRLLGRGGTDFPGRVALKICPGLLGELAKNVTTILVTGTNGKTTSARMIEQALADSGISFFANKSGANLLSGVTAEYAVHSSFLGKCRYTHALIETDEAAMKHINKFVQAKAILVTNVFRDQLDRYGDVTNTLENIAVGIEKSPDAVVCVNADDSLCSSLKQRLTNSVLFYGVDMPIYEKRVEELSDAPYCIHCHQEYVYDYVTYGHLGGYRCPGCGYRRPTPDLSVTKVISLDADSSTVVFSVDGEEHEVTINLPGGYNIYNACGSVAVCKALGLDMPVVLESLSRFACGFGRMEKFHIGQADLRMILIKNPAGCNQVLNFLSSQKEPFIFTTCLSDKPSDGMDISWIWDVDFEKLTELGDRLSSVYVSGPRADDMAMRFYYAGVPMDKIHVVKDYNQLTDELTDQPLPVFIMPTYTAMLDLRTHISKKYGVKDFWE